MQYCFDGEDGLVQLDDVRVVEAHQDLDLALDAPELLLTEFRLVVYFDCDFTFVVPIHSAADESVCALAQIPVELDTLEQSLAQYCLLFVQFIIIVMIVVVATFVALYRMLFIFIGFVFGLLLFSIIFLSIFVIFIVSIYIYVIISFYPVFDC